RREASYAANGAASRSAMEVSTATRATPRSSSGPTRAANCCGVSSKRSVPAAETGVSRETAGNQTSNTVPSWVIVAKPRADAEVIEYSSLRGVGDRYLRKYR